MNKQILNPEKKSKILNGTGKGISTPIGILIIVLAAIIAGAGIFAYQYYWMPEEKYIERPPLVKDEIANWKTYTNEEYGFEIKYPKDWTTKEKTGEYTDAFKKFYRFDIFYPEDINNAEIYGNVAVAVYDYYDDSNNDKFFDKEINLLKAGYSDGIIEEITEDSLNGLKATRYYQIDKAKSMDISELFIDREIQRVYKIWIWAIDFDKEVYQEQTKLILSTFRFLE